MSNDNRPGGGKNLPAPDVEWTPGGKPNAEMTEAAIKGILINPLYAGAGPFPPVVSDADWVAASKKLLRQDGPEQFLVNLLYVLRQSLNALDAH
jgi:hypothetical protein